MLTVFQSALGQMIILFLFMTLGYLLRKKGFLGPDTGKSLSKLELWVFCPCLNILTYARNCTVEVFVEDLPLILLSVVLLLVVAIPVSRLISAKLGRDEAERAVYRYSLCFSNSGYIGYPIVKAVFGEEVLMDTMIFCIPISIAIYTYGLYVLIPRENFTWKKLFNPSTLTPFIGMLIGFSGIALPNVLINAMEMGSDCMAPIAMLLTGFVLANQPLKTMVLNWRAYVASVIRLIAIPLFVAVTMFALNIRGELLLISATILAMPMGLNSVVFPEAFGGDATSGSQSNFISNLMGIITIPFMLALFQMLAF